jgi:hypothetical protein
MIASGQITQTGVVFPEQVFNEKLFLPFVEELEKRGVNLSHVIDSLET